jgi:hypothetical protein
MTGRRLCKPMPFVMIGMAFAPLAFPIAPASAQVAEGRFSVRATVVSTCTISTDAAAPAQSRASVACTNGGRWTLSEHSGPRDPMRRPGRLLMSAAGLDGNGGAIRVITITY